MYVNMEEVREILNLPENEITDAMIEQYIKQAENNIFKYW